MKVFRGHGDDRRLIGRADVSPDTGPSLVVPLFGAASTIVETYTVGIVTSFPAGSDQPLVERAILLADGQPPELLPGWTPIN